MSIYSKMEEAIHCADLSEAGHKLIIFAESALHEKNRATIVNTFYERLYHRAFADYAFSFTDDKYLVYDGKTAVGSYLGLALPRKSSPVKTLKEIVEFGHQIISNYVEPIGDRICKGKIKEIMQYLGDKYEFMNKVFSDKKAIFLLLSVSHIKYNSECLVFYKEGTVIQHLFLYNLKTRESVYSPEAVFFHELGHALHARIYGNTHTIPSDLITCLKGSLFS